MEHVLHNRFYEGKVVYDPGESDEEVREGIHEVPEEVKELWLKCQIVRQHQTREKKGRPRQANRPYPFTRVAVCESCGLPYGGQPVLQKSGSVIRRLYHKRPFCELKPHSVRVEHLMSQFQEGVLPHIALDQDWEAAVVRALSQEATSPSSDQEKVRLEPALANLRKQYLWGDITDEVYRQERRALDRQLETMTTMSTPGHLPNLKKAAQLLADLPSLWTHRRVTDFQTEDFIQEMFEQVQVSGSELVAIRPKTSYKPLFAYVIANGVRKCRGGQDRTADLLVPNQAPYRWATPRIRVKDKN